ncbi:MAG: hypothetical protein FWG99_10310 [Treponema sp.]|nr:hypothetical protein [Treponema sp.]
MRLLLCFVFLCIPLSFADSQEVSFGLEASRAENTGTYRPNSSGVYPVRLRWRQPDQRGSAFHVYRSVMVDSGFERISATPVQEGGGIFSFMDENPAAAPGKIFYYRIALSNAGGEAAVFSETVMGYGALTHECYWQEYNKTIKASHQKLTYMNKPGTTSKLGSEQVQGGISGSLSYQARVAGLGGRVIMQYENYADFYIDNNRALGHYFVLNGNTNTTASMAQNGTMDGVIIVTGMYPGRVYYDKVLIRGGAAGGGTYGVEPNGFRREELSWTLMER